MKALNRRKRSGHLTCTVRNLMTASAFKTHTRTGLMTACPSNPQMAGPLGIQLSCTCTWVVVKIMIRFGVP